MNAIKKWLGAEAVTLRPLFYMELTIAVASMIGGVMFLLVTYLKIEHEPFGVYGVLRDIAAIFGSDTVILIAGIVALLSGLMILGGIAANKISWRMRGLFLQFLLGVYTVLGSISVHGFIPLTWASGVTIVVVSGIIWLIHRQGERMNNGHRA